LETLANDSTIEEFLNHKIEGKKSIGKYSNNFTNKLINLDLAKKCNFDIPDTLITSDKRALIDFYKTHKSVICKSATQGSLIGEKTNLDGLTVLLNKNDIKLASKQFPPSLFQMNIEKSFEIRVFYLLGKTYSLAIFSQNNNKTKIDFRNYDHLNPNRTVPFCLPKNIEKKIITLMNKLSMNSGSIDLIYSKDAKYYFLEVNPVGQFDQVSYPCNYRLEKLIAMKLI
jgi:ATP-GRASP peptide maturase of grasp-with-spasm system